MMESVDERLKRLERMVLTLYQVMQPIPAVTKEQAQIFQTMANDARSLQQDMEN